MAPTPTHDPRWGETGYLSAEVRCPCGTLQRGGLPLHFRAGSLSLYELLRSSLAWSKLACSSCGAPFDAGTGTARAAAPIFGTGTWAGIILDFPRGDHHAAVWHDGPDLPSRYAEQSEIAIAHITGAPLSVRAAWHEALVRDEMGGDGHFPIGLGFMAVIADSHEEAQLMCIRRGQTDAVVISVAESEALRTDARPTTWLGDRTDQAERMFIGMSREKVARVIQEAADDCVLSFERIGPTVINLRNPDGTGGALPIDLERMAVRAVAHGLSPDVEAHLELMQLAREFDVRTRCRELVLAATDPSLPVRDHGAVMEIGRGDGARFVDLAALAQVPHQYRVAVLRALVA